MNGRKYLITALLTGIVLSVSGCGEPFPEMTEEEYNNTVEFAVGLLMKYSNNSQEKLTYVDAKAVTKQREREAEELEKEKLENAASLTTPSTDTATQAVTDVSGNATSDTIPLFETMEIADGVFLAYDGYSVLSTYPESSKGYVINADKGKVLLVLNFDLYNSSDSEKEVSMLDQHATFQIKLNGKNIGYSSVTVLPNDMSSYEGSLDADAHESLVLLSEIDEETSSDITSVGLIMSFNGEEQEVRLD
ncbi:MAG: hypothetical protein IJR29_01445 [Butyrivibrio sp.]|nr:hypothetical protein [Butyrivibrio sp.]